MVEIGGSVGVPGLASANVNVTLAGLYFLLQIAFVALLLYQANADNSLFGDGNDFFQTVQDKVIGFPECKAAFCVSPSQASLDTLTGPNAFNTFSTFFTSAAFGGGNPAQLFSFITLLFSGLDILKGIIGIMVAVSDILIAAQIIYGWDFFWGITPGQLRNS